MYFYMYKHCVLNKNIVYDLIFNRQIIIENDLLQVFNDMLLNVSCEELLSKYGHDCIKKFQNVFIGNKLGEVVDNISGRELITTYSDFALQLHETIPLELEQIVIELTGECNLNCKFCTTEDIVYRSCGCKKWKKQNEMDWKKFIQLSDEIIQLHPRTVVFSGGEPLLRKKLLFELIDKFAIDNIHSKIYTNGTLLDEEDMKFFLERDVEIILQIVALSENLYREITGVKNKIQHIIEMSKKYIVNGGKLSALLLICKENEDNISFMEKYLCEGEIEYFKAYIYPPNNHVSQRYYDESISCERKRNNFVNIQNYNFFKTFNNCLVDSIFINSSGVVYPCMMLRKFPLGDVQKEALYTVFRDKQYYEFWKLSKNSIDTCKNCGYNISCQDCRALEYQATDKIAGMRYCNLIKEVIE